MFAKLFKTKHGQLLLQKYELEEGKNCNVLEAKFNIVSPFEGAEAIVTRSENYPNTDEGEEARDEAFDEFSQSDADELCEEGL